MARKSPGFKRVKHAIKKYAFQSYAFQNHVFQSYAFQSYAFQSYAFQNSTCAAAPLPEGGCFRHRDGFGTILAPVPRGLPGGAPDHERQRQGPRVFSVRIMRMYSLGLNVLNLRSCSCDCLIIEYPVHKKMRFFFFFYRQCNGATAQTFESKGAFFFNTQCGYE